MRYRYSCIWWLFVYWPIDCRVASQAPPVDPSRQMLALSTCHRYPVTTELTQVNYLKYIYCILWITYLYSMYYIPFSISYSPLLLLQIMLTMRSQNRCSRQTTAMSTLYSMTPSYKLRRISSKKVISIFGFVFFQLLLCASFFLPLVLILLISFSANLDSKSYSK